MSFVSRIRLLWVSYRRECCCFTSKKLPINHFRGWCYAYDLLSLWNRRDDCRYNVPCNGSGLVGIENDREMLARLLNVVIIKRRSRMGWKGAPEPGVSGDLLVLLSQDRWVCMRGLVDDLKALTSGQWLRNETSVEGFAMSFATLLVFVSAALAGNVSTIGGLFTRVLAAEFRCVAGTL